MTVPFTEMTEDQFDSLMNVHFRGVYFLTQKLLPLLRDGGRIINLSSGTTRITLPGYSVYAPLKGAIEVWTRYLAKELGPVFVTTKSSTERSPVSQLWAEWECRMTSDL